MHLKQHRFLSILAASTVALTLSAAPAFAGSDGCAGGDCQDENVPATVVPAVPAPVAPAPLQTSNTGTGGTAPETASKAKSKKTTTKQTRTTQTRTVAVAQRTIPQGAVAAGAGGTAPDGSNGVIFGLAGAALVMFAAGGRLVVAARRS